MNQCKYIFSQVMSLISHKQFQTLVRRHKGRFSLWHLEIFYDRYHQCMSYVVWRHDKDNFSILTTQGLTTKEKGVLSSGNLNGALVKQYGDFKGFKNEPLTFGLVQLNNGNDLRYFIETGRASMVMVYGVSTRIQI